MTKAKKRSLVIGSFEYLVLMVLLIGVFFAAPFSKTESAENDDAKRDLFGGITDFEDGFLFLKAEQRQLLRCD